MGGQSAKETKSAQAMLLKIQYVCVLDFSKPPSPHGCWWLMNGLGWQFVFPSPDQVSVVGFGAE